MEALRFEASWPQDSLSIDCYTHEVSNFRYHWHDGEYEIGLILNGRLECCHELERYILEPGDVSLHNPGEAHTSFAQEPHTCGLVLHIAASAFQDYAPKGSILHFTDCRSNANTRSQKRFRLVRMYTAQIYEALSGGSPFAQLNAKAATEMLLSTMCRYFQPQPRPAVSIPETTQEAVRRIVSYIEGHYAEKLTLEELASYSQYNRTYISTLFKDTLGVNFYDYLTRLRFQHALLDMTSSDRSLTEIALANGFSDLKGFRKQFKETFGRTPAQYRELLSFGQNFSGRGQWRYIPGSDEAVRQRLQEFQHI